MMKPKILFIGGSLNQTTICHAVARHLEAEYDCYFTPFYTDGWLERARRWGWLDFSVLGHPRRLKAEAYLHAQGLRIDYGGKQHAYALVVMVSDLLIPAKVWGKKVILIQEGMTDPETCTISSRRCTCPGILRELRLRGCLTYTRISV